jgi:hypothetical protein
MNLYKCRLLTGFASLTLVLILSSLAWTGGSTSLTGTVTLGKDKSPLAGAVVKVENVATKTFFASQPTDATGGYRLDNLPQGLYRVGVSMVEGDFLLEDLAEIERNGSETMNIVLVKTARGLLSLHFRNNSSESSLEGARVYFRNTATMQTYQASPANAGGDSAIAMGQKGLPDGEYQLMMVHNGEKIPYNGTISVKHNRDEFVVHHYFNFNQKERSISATDKDPVNIEPGGPSFLSGWGPGVGIVKIGGVHIRHPFDWPTPDDMSPWN